MGNQIGVNCERGKIKWSECETCRLNPLRPCHVTPDLLQLIRRKPAKAQLEQSYSPSRMTGCDRQYVLMRDADYYENIRSSWPLVRGTMIHAILESAGVVDGYDQTLREIRLTTKVDVDGEEVEVEQQFDPTKTEVIEGQEIFTGQPDLLLRNGNRVKIVDYKTTTISHDLLAAKLPHVRQINMYAWLARRCLPAILGVESIEIDELEILYLSQEKTRRFTSAGSLKDRGKLISRKGPRGSSWQLSENFYETLTLEAIMLADDRKVEDWIIKRIKERRQALTTLPPILTGDAALMCIGCPVREKCMERARTDGKD